MKSPYTVVIQWSEDDRCFVVFLPEFAGRVMQPVTYGDSYEEALSHAQEVLELLIEDAIEEGIALPSPIAFIDRSFFKVA
jgi:antitoxin HicB